MKAATILIVLPVALSACVVNPDADRALKEQARRNDSIASAERGTVQPVPPDTGQHDMPVIKPTAPVESDMPVVNPADTSAHKPL